MDHCRADVSQHGVDGVGERVELLRSVFSRDDDASTGAALQIARDCRREFLQLRIERRLGAADAALGGNGESHGGQRSRRDREPMIRYRAG
jgi:hypothetical protein